MKKRLVIILLLILLSFSVYGVCIDPKNRKTFFENTQFCTQTYQLRDGISIGQDTITLDCGNAVIQGLFIGKTGLTIENKKEVTIKNCVIMNYDVGIYLINSTNITITNVAFIRNQVGIKIEKSDKNFFIKNRDISLKKPIQEIESFENVFHYENKKINADFCRYNTCNEEKYIERTNMPEAVIYGRTTFEAYSLKKILIEAIMRWINTD